LRISTQKWGYVFIDDMLITLEGISDGLIYKRIGRIFLIKQTDEEVTAAAEAKEEAKANMTMKEKIAAAKDALKKWSERDSK
jgi:hypothetical protein